MKLRVLLDAESTHCKFSCFVEFKNVNSVMKFHMCEPVPDLCLRHFLTITYTLLSFSQGRNM